MYVGVLYMMSPTYWVAFLELLVSHILGYCITNSSHACEILILCCLTQRNPLTPFPMHLASSMNDSNLQ